MKVETQTFRGYGKRKELTTQTAVECRFTQDVATVLTSACSAVLAGADAGNGEVRYYGKAHFSIVYEDAEKRVCRAERGVEWSAVVKDDFVFPALTARAQVACENISVRREGASVYMTALLGCDISLYGEQTFDYLSGGDLIVKREPVHVLTCHLVSGAAEADDEFETEFITDILQHTEAVNVTSIVTETGMLKVEGDVNLAVLALKEGAGLVSFERLVPFRLEIPCEAAAYGASAEADVAVVSSNLRANSDEEKNKCVLTCELSLALNGCVYEEVEVDAVVDAFSATSHSDLVFASCESAGVGDTFLRTERISGKCALSSPVDFSDNFQAITLARAEAELVSSERGMTVDGVAMSTLLVVGADGTRRGIELSLPFSVPVDTANAKVRVHVLGMSARQKQEGEVEAEATLKITMQEERKISARLVASAEEGDLLPVNDSAVSVYIPRAGDGLWELAKSLKKSPEEVAASNPDMEFPIKAGQRVIVYRKKSV